MKIPFPLQKAICLALPGGSETPPRLRPLLVGFAFSTIAQFLFSSIMAIHLLGLGLSPTSIGVVAFCFYTSLRCYGPIAGVLIETYGIRPVYASGVSLSVLGYVGFAFGRTLLMLVISVMAIGIGLGVDALCRSVILVQESESKESGNQALALYYVVFNLAASIGPLLASVALSARRPIYEVFLAAAVTQGLTGSLFLILFRFSAAEGAQATRKPGFHALRTAWRSRIFRSFLFRLPLIWFVFSVMHSLVPVFLIAWVQFPKNALPPIFSWNAILVVLLGYRIQKRMTSFLKNRGLSKFYGIALGSTLMALGIFSLLLASRFPSTSVYMFMTIFTLGELCFIPMVQAIVNDCTPEGGGSRGLYFGLASLAWGLGAGLSNLVGGIILALCRQIGYECFPLILGSAAVAIAVNYFHLGRNG
jgi:MFS family permease